MSDIRETPVQDVPAIMVTFTHQLDDHRSMCLQTAIASDCSAAELNQRLDTLSVASNRQRAITRLPTVYGLLEIRKAQFREATEKLFSVEAQKGILHSEWSREDHAAGRRETGKLTPKRTADMQRVDSEHAKHAGDLLVCKKEIEALELEIADLETKKEG